MDNKTYKEKLITRAYAFSLTTIRLIADVRTRSYAVETISKQLIRSATSIGANIVESQASPTRKDFSNFMNHALKSSNETRYWLALLRDTEPNVSERVKPLLAEATELSKILGSTIKTLKMTKTI